MPVALVCFLGACGSATADSNSEQHRRAVATPTPLLRRRRRRRRWLSGGVYDASVGMAVDADGFAICRCAAARIIFSSILSPGRTPTAVRAAQQPSNPLKSIPAAFACVGTARATRSCLRKARAIIGTPVAGRQEGYSATYPMVIPSYDPADPINEARYGRGDQRGARPVPDRVLGARQRPQFLRHPRPRLQSRQHRRALVSASSAKPATP